MNNLLLLLYLIAFFTGVSSTTFSFSIARKHKSRAGKLFAWLWLILLLTILLNYINFYKGLLHHSTFGNLYFSLFLAISVCVISVLILMITLRAALKDIPVHPAHKFICALLTLLSVVVLVILFLTPWDLQWRGSLFTYGIIPGYLLFILYAALLGKSTFTLNFMAVGVLKPVLTLSIIFILLDLIFSVIIRGHHSFHAYPISYLICNVIVVKMGERYDRLQEKRS